MSNSKGNSSSSVLDFPYPSIRIGAIITVLYYGVLLNYMGEEIAFILMFIISTLLFIPYFLGDDKYKNVRNNNFFLWLYYLLVSSLATTAVSITAAYTAGIIKTSTIIGLNP